MSPFATVMQMVVNVPHSLATNKDLLGAKGASMLMELRTETKTAISEMMGGLQVLDVDNRDRPKSQHFVSLQGSTGVRTLSCSILLLLHKCHCPKAPKVTRRVKTIPPKS